MRTAKIVVRSIILIFYNLFLRFLLRESKRDCKYNVSICAIFKNEASFLKEWIEYHLMLGVEHFYMYNNNSEDNFKDVLRPYIDNGVVEIKDWTENHAQMMAYKDFYESRRHETKWVSFLDIDEFICLRNVFTTNNWKAKYGNKISSNNLSVWLESYAKYPGVLMYFKMFGTSGLINHDYSKLVIEQYTISWKGLYKIGKCFINTQYDIADYNTQTHHCPALVVRLCGFKFKVRPVNALKIFVDYDIHFSWLYKDSWLPVQVNHYWSKAMDVYENQMKMTDVYFKESPKKDPNYFYYHEEHNVTADYTIFKNIARLKNKINNKGY